MLRSLVENVWENVTTTVGNIMGKRKAAENNKLVNSRFDKNHEDSKMESEADNDLEEGKEDPNFKSMEKEIDIPALLADGEDIFNYPEFCVSYEDLWNKHKSHTKACEEFRLNLANRVCFKLDEIWSKYDVPSDLRNLWPNLNNQERIKNLKMFVRKC